MKIITDLKSPLQLHRPIVTVGTFDGVHVGHQSIFEVIKNMSAKTGGDMVLVTFDPHPRLVLGKRVLLLSTRDEKREALQNAGITHLVEIPFTKEFSKLPAAGFVELIVNKLKPESIVIGYDHGFGRDRGGSIEHLYAYSNSAGFNVVEIPELELGSRHISSSVVRWLLQEGDVANASVMLGRPYSITGKVVKGNQLGKQMGYPTANLYIEDPNKLIPAMGVYASRVHYQGDTYMGMTNIGMRPTINANKLTFETNIFDFDKDIYGESLKVELIKRIRNEKKFGNLEILIKQLGIDREKTFAVLSEEVKKGH